MVYRRTDKVRRRLAQRRAAILAAAQAIAAESGMAGVQIAPVADRAGIAAGTVYRYFPSKSELLAALVEAVSERECEAMRRAAAAAPGPLSALAASIATFASRAAAQRRLAWAMLAEASDADVDSMRLGYRRALAAELQARIEKAIATGHLPDQDVSMTAAAVIGALLEGLIGPLAPAPGDESTTQDQVRMLTLLALRAAGVADPRARGLVVQTALPAPGGDFVRAERV